MSQLLRGLPGGLFGWNRALRCTVISPDVPDCTVSYILHREILVLYLFGQFGFPQSF
ncbi:hypothetical protein KI387_001415, partial [Taxus chinensis]